MGRSIGWAQPVRCSRYWHALLFLKGIVVDVILDTESLYGVGDEQLLPPHEKEVPGDFTFTIAKVAHPLDGFVLGRVRRQIADPAHDRAIAPNRSV